VHSAAPIAPKASAACKCSTPLLPDIFPLPWIVLCWW
jgi:hypothetical protein